MSDNPYAPPESPAPADAKAAAPLRDGLYFVLFAAVAAYFIAIEGSVDMAPIKEALASGVLPALPVLCFLIGSGALLVGFGRHMYAPWQGKYAFVLAAATLGIGLVADVQATASDGRMRIVFALGIGTALFGIWLAHRTWQVLMAALLEEKEEQL